MEALLTDTSWLKVCTYMRSPSLMPYLVADDDEEGEMHLLGIFLASNARETSFPARKAWVRWLN